MTQKERETQGGGPAEFGDGEGKSGGKCQRTTLLNIVHEQVGKFRQVEHKMPQQWNGI